MYYLKKKIKISSAHQLELDYDSGCKNLHGHNWNITVFCKSEKLNKNGMIIDFADIKKIIGNFDHKYLNDFIKNPTAENIAKYLCDKIPFCYKIKIEETEGNEVVYVR